MRTLEENKSLFIRESRARIKQIDLSTTKNALRTCKTKRSTSRIRLLWKDFVLACVCFAFLGRAWSKWNPNEMSHSIINFHLDLTCLQGPGKGPFALFFVIFIFFPSFVHSASTHFNIQIRCTSSMFFLDSKTCHCRRRPNNRESVKKLFLSPNTNRYCLLLWDDD